MIYILAAAIVVAAAFLVAAFSKGSSGARGWLLAGVEPRSKGGPSGVVDYRKPKGRNEPRSSIAYAHEPFALGTTAYGGNLPW